MRHPVLFVGSLLAAAACGNSSGDERAALGGAATAPEGQGVSQTGGESSGQLGPAGGASGAGANAGGSAATATPGGSASEPDGATEGASRTDGTATSGATTSGATTSGATTSGATTSGAGTAGSEASSGDQSEATGAGGAGAGDETSDTGGASGDPAGCIGDVWPTADPTSAGPFQVAADKNVGPLAGDLPDPIYGDEQQRFNVYRPANLADSGYCHPILIWANGYTDNPEPNPPLCVVDSAANQWCGQYLPMMNHLASHGFVVVASLSTATGRGDPLPTLVGLDWILEQAEDPSSPYYQRLDTANIGQLGHSFGGMSTCMSASDSRYKALATICGTSTLEGVHTPMLFFCGGNDTVVDCAGVRDTFLTVTEQPAFFINELDADHGSWVYEGPGGVSLSSAAAWFRVHLMNDVENRKYFYGADCTFCSDDRVQVEQNSLMAQ